MSSRDLSTVALSADVVETRWAELMRKLRSYYQLCKPGIIYGNLLTACAGYLLAAKLNLELPVLPGLLVGTALVIASACVFNNYLDRNIDKKMQRTQQRAMVTGAISGRAALLYATILGAVGFAGLAFTNWLTIGIGAFAMVSYVVLYGYAKRRSAYGTLVGTLPGAASLVAGYVAVSDRFDSGAVVLVLIMVAWQMAHFYAIAIYRLKDYKAAGIPVWPAVHGVGSTKIHMLLYVVAFSAATLALTALGYTGYVYVVVMAGCGVYWLAKAVQGLGAADNEQWARQMFVRSLLVLLVLSVMLPLGAVLP